MYISPFAVSSVYSDSTTPLYRRPLALHWLSALHITMCWLPALNIALVWLPTTRFFITRAPNMLTRLEVELQPEALHWLPVALHWLPQLGFSSQGLQTESRIIVMGHTLSIQFIRCFPTLQLTLHCLHAAAKP